jgi:hypothetical protein
MVWSQGSPMGICTAGNISSRVKQDAASIVIQLVSPVMALWQVIAENVPKTSSLMKSLGSASVQGARLRNTDDVESEMTPHVTLFPLSPTRIQILKLNSVQIAMPPV